MDHNLRLMPLLIVAHVLRSMLPSPVDGAHMYSFWLLRLVLYAAAFIALRRKAIGLDSWFGVLLLCTVVVSTITVLLYSGDDRYLYPLNILLVVLVCSTGGYESLVPILKSRRQSTLARKPVTVDSAAPSSARGVSTTGR